MTRWRWRLTTGMAKAKRCDDEAVRGGATMKKEVKCKNA